MFNKSWLKKCEPGAKQIRSRPGEGFIIPGYNALKLKILARGFCSAPLVLRCRFKLSPPTTEMPDLPFINQFPHDRWCSISTNAKRSANNGIKRKLNHMAGLQIKHVKRRLAKKYGNWQYLHRAGSNITNKLLSYTYLLITFPLYKGDCLYRGVSPGASSKQMNPAGDSPYGLHHADPVIR
jgi:hypothetical protein